MKKLNMRILSAILALVLLLSDFPVLTSADNSFFIACKGESVSRVEIQKDEKLAVSAENLPEGCGYQWQINIPGTDTWVDIQGQTSQTLNLSHALLGSLMDADGCSYVRCAAVGGEETGYTDDLCVAVKENAPEEPVAIKAPVAVESKPVAEVIVPWKSRSLTAQAEGDSGNFDDDTTIFTITIEYVYADSSKFKGQRVALPYIEEVPSGGTPKILSVPSPTAVGYAPDQVSVGLPTTVTGDLAYVVAYYPDTVSYTVRHYQQNINNDDYTWVDTTVVQALTESWTDNKDAANTYTGFEALAHYSEEVAADSSTMVDIYYDREYYLMAFELEGGYGTEAIYARYGTEIIVAKPYKAGYEFDGWDKSVPATMPAEDMTFKASWTADTDISFTVTYWLENPNDHGQYNYWASFTSKGEAGQKVQGDTYKDYTQYLSNDVLNKMDAYEKEYSYYSHADTDVEIAGDGSTIVNVYYNRNEYTLKFYYSMENVTVGTHHIVGGSTYYFGALAGSMNYMSNGSWYTVNTSDEKELMKLYLDPSVHTGANYPSSQVGKTQGKPSLKTADDSRYTQSFDTTTVGTTNWKLYYISFKAKYGQDISDLWPCDVFNSVTMDQETDFANSNQAFVSAWNGECNIWYSQKNTGNQTIKGKYSELDYKLLWADGKAPDGETFTYLCFWENGAKVGWSKPSLFRYNVCVPYIESEKDLYLKDDKGAYLTKEYNDGKTYYILERYNTVDDSWPDKQTPPAINGLIYIGYDDDELLSSFLYDANGKQIYDRAYDVFFCYSRKQYNLVFENNGVIEESKSVDFGEDISDMAPEVTYHDPNQAHLYTFGGWCTSPDTQEESIVSLSGETMPANDLTLYAKWNLITYDVEIYLTEDATTAYDSVEVTHNSLVSKEHHPNEEQLKEEYGNNSEFIGWFYRDSNGIEQAFDFDTVAITQKIKVYAKWRSNESKEVVIKYAIVDDDGKIIEEVASQENLVLRVGQTRTFDAKTGNALFAEYQTGCFPTTATHSITPTSEDVDNENPITYTFTYKKYGKVPYQVKFYVEEEDGTKRPAFKTTGGKAEFVDSDTYASWNVEQKNTFGTSNSSVSAGGSLADDGQYIELHWDNDRAVVTELHIPDQLAVSTWELPDWYLPSALKLQKIIVPSETDPQTNIAANTIEFVYTYMKPEEVDPTDPTGPTDPTDPTDPGTTDPDEPVYKALYLVQHFVQSIDDENNYEEHSYSTHDGLSGTTAKASPISIPGYTYSVEKTQQYMTEYNSTRTDVADNSLEQNPDSMSGTITADDKLELNFYYTVKSYPYQVLYLEEGTNRVLKAAKTTDSNGNLLKAKYNSKVTETAPEIEGYDVVTEGCVLNTNGDAQKSIYIQMEAGDTANVNTIVFYYVEKNADLVITKEVRMDEEQATHEGFVGMPDSVKNQEFVFTVTATKGFLSSVYDYTIYDGDNPDGTMGKVTTKDTLTLNPISIKGGQKIVIHDLAMGEYTVTEAYEVGYRTSVEGTITPSTTVNLDEADETEEIHFVNTFPFYTGDLVVMKHVRNNGELVQTNRTYKVRITLYPENETREVERVIMFVDGNGNPCSDVSGSTSLTIPKLSADSDTSFEIIINVPAGGEVKLVDAPAGTFKAEELPNGTVGTITDYYSVYRKAVVHKSQEPSFERSTSIESEIHGGHPTAVIFGNTCKKGSLTITKTVTQEYPNDSWKEDTFTFAISGTTELPDGDYSTTEAKVTVSNGVVTVKDSDGNDPTISVSRTEGESSWIKSLTFTDLPAGYYKVTETSSVGNLNQYTCVGETQSLLVNDNSNSTIFAFTNTFKRTIGNLQVGKEIVIVTDGTAIDSEQLFDFEVVAKDGTLTGSYACKVMETNGTWDNTSDDTVVEGSTEPLMVNDNKLSFQLTHNQYILIQGLPVGEYAVKEYAVEGYNSSFGDLSGGNLYSVDPAIVMTGETTVLKCKNAYPVYYANLVIKKIVVDSDVNSDVDQAPDGDQFSFTVQISGYSDKVDLTNGIAANFYESETDTEPTISAMAVKDDVLTLTLKHGQWYELNLPVCTYTVTETSMTSAVNSGALTEHYDVTSSVGSENGTTSLTSSLISGEKETVVFTNTYKQHFGDLTITQSGMKHETDSGIYEVVNSSGEVISTVVITGNKSVFLKQVPVDTYTIQEISADWTWTYEDTGVNDPTVLIKTNPTAEDNKVTFQQTAKTLIDWLHTEMCKLLGGI